MGRKKEERKRICLSTVKERGWTDSLIKKYLPEPMLATNPVYHSSAKMKLWYEDVVIELESTIPEFAEAQAKKAERQLKREQKIQELSENINVRNPALDYTKAREMSRHFVLHVGDTNTGKTYESLQALKNAESGIYLAPLRLLAMEIQDKMLEDGVLCSMVTGEEENIVDGANLMSCTVEKLNINNTYEVGVIDECQMIADRNRGGAWTRAILGLVAERIYLCMSPDAKDICIKLIELCGDTYEVIEHKRDTELRFVGVIGEGGIRKNDAVILFSRKNVLWYAEKLKNKKGLKPSVIYGALPYRARKEQVRKYINGETDIVVSTDAIGMGMNLPIKRVVFVETMKYNGLTTDLLEPNMVKQIAGRAGRRGMFDVGEVATFKQDHVIENGLTAAHGSIKKAYLPFPEELLNFSTEKLSRTMANWREFKYPDMFHQQDVEFIVEKSKYLERTYKGLPVDIVFRLSMIMFDESNPILFGAWKHHVHCLMNGYESNMPSPNEWDDLYQLELIHKKIGLFYSFHKTMGLEFDYDELMKQKEKTVNLINKLLLEEYNKKNQKKKVKRDKYFDDFHYFF